MDWGQRADWERDQYERADREDQAMTEDTELGYGDTSIHVEIVGMVRHEGTIVVLAGVDDEGENVGVVSEPRYARDIFEAIVAGETPEVFVEGWQLWGSWETCLVPTGVSE